MSKEQYQKIYEDKKWYGNASINRCPSVRLLDKYISHLEQPIIDLGCGRGDCVHAMRNAGFESSGIDQIDLNNDMMVGSILENLDMSSYNTALCIDVIEHIDDDGVEKLFDNMKQCDVQIFAIHNGPSVLDGVELHINRKTWDEWDDVIQDVFDVVECIAISPEQVLYITRKNDVK